MVIGRRGIHRYLRFDEDIVKVQQSLVIDSPLAIAPRGASLSSNDASHNTVAAGMIV